jgi:RNA polymerase sigma factor (sigma-70 family)
MAAPAQSYVDEAAIVCRRALSVAASVNREHLPGLEVQDLAQDVRLAVLSTTARRYDRGLNSSRGGYLHKRRRGAARDAVRFERRHATRRLPTDGDLAVFASADILPDQEAARSEMRDLLMEAMQDMAPRWRTVITCLYFRGMTLKETAAILKASEARVAQIKQLAIKKLKASLLERGITGASSAIF